MSAITYLWGVLLLGTSIWLLVRGAGQLVSTILPDWRGPTRYLAMVIAALGWVYAVSFVLGAVGLFRIAPLYGLIDVGAVATWWALSQRGRPDRTTIGSDVPDAAPVTSGPGAVAAGRSPRRWGLDQLATIAAAVGAVLVAAAWLPGTAHAYRNGILEPDSLWYHGHFSARFVQTGWITRINPVGVDTLVPFHLANRELLDAVLDLPWHRDIALPGTNLVYLSLLLLAGWCIGDRWGRGRLGLLVVAAAASPPVMIVSQPGSLKNDLWGMALLLAGLALFVHSDRRLGAVALAGVALGLAAGTRSNLLVVVIAIVAFGALALVREWTIGRPGGDEPRPLPDRARSKGRAPAWTATAAWVGATVVFGSYWYLRNWIRTGNPIPWLGIDRGPLHLSPVRPGVAETSFEDQTLADYFDYPHLLRDVVRPGLRFAFGDLWWAWALLLVVATVLVAVRITSGTRRSRDLWLGGMAVTGMVGLGAHLVTPLSLAVAPDSYLAPFNFAFNTRYALPAGLLVLLAGACAVGSRRGEAVLSLVVLGILVSGLFPTRLTDDMSQDGTSADAPLALLVGGTLGVVAAWVLVGWPWLQRRQIPARRLVGMAVPTLMVVGVGFPIARNYVNNRYMHPVPHLSSVLWPTTTHLDDVRIGVAADPKPYPLEGNRLSNRVSYIGITVPDNGGVLRDVVSCQEWVDTILSLDLDYVAVIPEPFAGELSPSAMRSWTLAIPGSEVATEQFGQMLVRLPDTLPSTAEVDCPTDP